MRTKELGDILKNKYDNALKGEKVTQIYLFAISHAKEIQENNYRISEIVKYSNISQSSYSAEVYKGIKLAKYVEIEKSNSLLNAKNFIELGQILKSMYDNLALNTHWKLIIVNIQLQP
jgi:hypothetical protein